LDQFERLKPKSLTKQAHYTCARNASCNLVLTYAVYCGRFFANRAHIWSLN